MKKAQKLTVFAALCAVALAFVGCAAAESVGDDASKTPIGSVVTGETRTSGSYIKRVKEDNQRLDRDTWRPETSDRF